MSKKEFSVETVNLYYPEEYKKYSKKLNPNNDPVMDKAIREKMYEAAGVGQVDNIDLEYIKATAANTEKEYIEEIINK